MFCCTLVLTLALSVASRESRTFNNYFTKLTRSVTITGHLSLHVSPVVAWGGVRSPDLFLISACRTASWTPFFIMFVAIVGTRFSGKSSIVEYLISSKGFTSIKLIESDSEEVVVTDDKFEVLIITVLQTYSNHLRDREQNILLVCLWIYQDLRVSWTSQDWTSSPSICLFCQWVRFRLLPQRRIQLPQTTKLSVSPIPVISWLLLLETGEKTLSQQIYLQGIYSSHLFEGRSFCSWALTPLY